MKQSFQSVVPRQIEDAEGETVEEDLTIKIFS